MKLKLFQSLFPVNVFEILLGERGKRDDDDDEVDDEEEERLPKVASKPSFDISAHQHEGVTVMFMDVVGFTAMSSCVSPYAVMRYLRTLFDKLDLLCNDSNIYKVETAGDCYIVAGGLMTVQPDGWSSFDPAPNCAAGAESVWRFALATQAIAHAIPMPHTGLPTQVRIGIHTGSTSSCVIGSKLPKFSLFGDTMNTSARMESTCPPDSIQVSADTYRQLSADARANLRPTGGIDVKGKGVMITYVQ